MGWKQITIEEREVIMIRLEKGTPVARIAREINRHRSTIYRELYRNRDSWRYRAYAAHQNALRRRRRARRPAHMSRPRLYDYVDQNLQIYWSPEQIAQRIRIDFPNDLSMRVCHETIYRFILRQARGYIRFLRQGDRRNRYAWRGKKRFKRIRNTKSIEQRPVEAEQRNRCGDWEADSVRGSSSVSLATQVDRATRYLIAARLSDRKAATYNGAVIRAFRAQGLPVYTMTVDNGMEFAEFPQLEKALKAKVYFAHAYHAWERGTNENTNGLLRQFFPKGIDFSGVNPRRIQQVVDLLNNRPRKCLGYRTPAEAIEAMLVAFRD